MECEFQNIESLIRNVINSTTKSNGSLAAHFAKARSAVAEERSLIKKQFSIHALTFGNRRQTEWFVHYHQRYLVTLIDELFELSQSASKRNCKYGSSLAAETFFFYDQLMDILDFIRQQFPMYFNGKIKLPEPERIKFIKDAKRKYSVLRTILENKKADQVLISVCSHPIVKAIDSHSETTYQKAFFIETLLEEMQRVVDNAHESINDNVRALLIHIGYNDESYFTHYVDFIKSELSEIESPVDQLERLAFHCKIINQSHSRVGLIYDDELPPIREQLTNWIVEEIHYLEKRERLSAIALTKDETATKNFKIEFDMSVSQLACLIKVFIEAGIIRNKNITELLRFLSQFVKTKHSEHISTESFRIKYYDVESGTKNAVRNLFHTAISYINSN